MKTFWTVLISFVVTAGVVGSGTYYYVNHKVNANKDNLQAQIDDLNAKIANTNTDTVDITNSNTNDNSSTDDIAATTNANKNSNTAQTADWKAYKNSTYGFSFTFPNNSWKNYKVINYVPTDKSATAYLYFAVPTTDSSWNELHGAKGYASPFALSVFTKAQWAQNPPLPGTTVGQNDNYVFTMTGWQDSPKDLKGVDFGIQSIESSFKAN